MLRQHSYHEELVGVDLLRSEPKVSSDHHWGCRRRIVPCTSTRQGQFSTGMCRGTGRWLQNDATNVVDPEKRQDRAKNRRDSVAVVETDVSWTDGRLRWSVHAYNIRLDSYVRNFSKKCMLIVAALCWIDSIGKVSSGYTNSSHVTLTLKKIKVRWGEQFRLSCQFYQVASVNFQWIFDISLLIDLWSIAVQNTSFIVIYFQRYCLYATCK